jgi:hypothetical protein
MNEWFKFVRATLFHGVIESHACLKEPGHGSPVSTITPPEIVVPSLKLGGLREVRFKPQTCPDNIGY